MQRFSQKSILVLIAALFLTTISFAQDPPPPAASGPEASIPEIVPDELQDPAFDQYVDMKYLRGAWNRLDATALADAGLQLAEGERVLFRSHHAMTADQVLRAAVRVAGEKQDKKTLDRLAKAAKKLQKTELASKATAAKQLASASRSASSAPTMSLDDLSPVDFAYYRAGIDGIEASRIRGDSKDLEEFTADLNDDDQLPAEMKQHLLKLAGEARSAVDAKSAEQNDTLDKLLSPSRANGVWSVYNIVPDAYGRRHGPVKVRVNGGSPKSVYYQRQRAIYAPLGNQMVEVLRTDGTWHGLYMQPGFCYARSVFGVYYITTY